MTQSGHRERSAEMCATALMTIFKRRSHTELGVQNAVQDNESIQRYPKSAPGIGNKRYGACGHCAATHCQRQDQRSSHFDVCRVCFQLAGRRGVTALKPLVFGDHLRAKQEDDARDFEAQQPDNRGRQRAVDDADD